MRTILIYNLLLLLPYFVAAQNGEPFFNQARNYVTAQQLDSAIGAINLACQAEESNLDYRLYRARINSWRNDFEPAFSEIQSILDKKPNNPPAQIVLMGLLRATKAWGKLDTLAVSLLEPSTFKGFTLEDSVQLIQKYAWGLLEQKRYAEAEKMLRLVRNHLTPLWQEAKISSLNKTISAHFTQYKLKTDQPDWQILELEYIHKLSKMTYSVGINRATRFNRVGTQALLQLYPYIGKKAYAWLIGGVSEGTTYPKYIYGASFFLFALPNTEFETGLRFFTLNGGETVKILRGGIVFDNAVHRIGYNIGQVSSLRDNGLTHILFYQKYLKKTQNFIRVGIAKGSNINNLLTPQFDSFIINSFVTNATVQYCFNSQWRLLMGVSYEQYKNTLTQIPTNRWVYDAGLIFKFK
jgi:YaiO family outer membrane protein